MSEVCSLCKGNRIRRSMTDPNFGYIECECVQQEKLIKYLKQFATVADLEDSPLLKTPMNRVFLLEVETNPSRMTMNSWQPHVKKVLVREFYEALAENRPPLHFHVVDADRFVETRFKAPSEDKWTQFREPDLLLFKAAAFPGSIYFFRELEVLIKTRAEEDKGTWIISSNFKKLLEGGYELTQQFRLMLEALLLDKDSKTKLVSLGIEQTKALKITKDPVLPTKGLGMAGINLTILKQDKGIDSRISQEMEKELVSSNDSNRSDGKPKGK